MHITVHTLVDITETLTRKGPETKKVRQQNNHDTLLQACSLRANVEMLSCEQTVGTQEFGSANEGKNRYWTLKLQTDYPFTQEDLLDDLDFLSFLVGLDETGLIHNNILQTKDLVYKNTIFLLDDK